MKKYTLTVEYKAGCLTIAGDNYGFNAFELYGILMHKADDIHQQIHGKIIPEAVTMTRKWHESAPPEEK